MPEPVIIQCAARKDGAYLRAPNGDRVPFVAEPKLAPSRSGWILARPDDPAADGRSWRTVLCDYNERFSRTGDNPDNLRPAWQLYTNPTYRCLVRTFGASDVYILSAGWGLVRAGYLLPNYDITFLRNNKICSYKIMHEDNLFHDARQMPNDTEGPVRFFGGLSYLPLFGKLTCDVRAERIVYYNSNRLPDAPGCRLVRYMTSTRTNWHYECARELMSGHLAAR